MGDDFRISYVSPREDFRLDSGRESGVFIEVDTLEGFVGVFEDTGVEPVGVPGVVVDFRDRVVSPVEGSFTLVVSSVEDWWRVYRAFSTRDYGTLHVGEFRLPVRLAESLPFPSAVPVGGARVVVRLRGDGGVWFAPLSSNTNFVNVTNWGDVPVWPTLVWDGAGGAVTLPSKATFTLPPVSGEHTLYLDRVRAGEVYDPNGVYDRELTATVDAVSEGVPIGEQREYAIPTGARLAWNVGVFNPWQQ